MATELNFIILKINGSDVRRLTRNDTVQMFLKAQKESILIEMQRKCNDNDYVDLDEGVNIQSATYDGAVGTIGLTDLITKVSSSSTHNAGDINTKLECLHLSKTSSTTQKHLMLTLKLQKDLQQKQEHTNQISKCTQTENSSGYFVMEQQHQQNLEQHHMASKKHADRLIEEEHSLFEQCLAPEIDIEEITLRKSASNERLGLTVCYSIGESNNSNGSGGSGGSVINNVANIINGSVGDGASSNCDDNETCTEVYISDIHADSIAGRDGRLRQGDQIIQINGKDVKNKDETEALIAENCNAVTLLVSRYLYADDDDFNDPSVVELDVVDDVYDEDADADDVEEDEEDDLYYDDNNLPYENCFIPTEKKFKNAVEDLDKVLLQAAQQQQQQQHDSENKAAAIAHNIEYRALVDKKSNIQRISNDMQQTPFSTKDSATNCKLKTYVFCDASTNGHHESQKQQHQNKSLNNRETSQNQQLVAASKQATATNKLTTAAAHASNTNADYDTEHIYETIPEDSESEPFYCSPYESSVYVTAMGTCSSTVDALQLQQQKHQQQKQQLRVAQWLGLKAQPIPATVAKQLATRKSGSVGNNSRYHRNDTVQSIVTTITNGSSSSGGTNGNSFLAATVAGNSSNALLIDERDNSSSAYNTGGSNNSGSPFVLQLNHQQIAATRNISAAVEDDQSQMFANARSSSKQTQQRLQSLKDQKIPSPKNSALLLLGSKGAAGGSYVAVGNGVSKIDAQQQYSPKTGYENESVAHTHQTMGLQQHIMGRQQEPHILHFPQFTAPNLSQYHFVSSQEVSTTVSSAVAASVNNNGNALHTMGTTATMQQKSKQPSNEESTTMVWKVKRRPDGTRYIVRRPAATIALATTESAAATPRSRILRADRTLRMRMRSNDNHVVTTTTEDDTISEVKTGRYWSKEERKKHIERARERRQLHLQLQQHFQHLQLQQNQNSSSIPTMRVSDRITNKLQQQQYLLTQQQQPNDIRSTPLLATATATKTKTAAKQLELQQYHQLQFKSITMPPAELKISAQFVSAKSFASDIEFYGAMESRTDVETTATATDVTNDEASEKKYYEEQTQHCKPSNLSQQEHAIATEDSTRIIKDLLTITSV